MKRYILPALVVVGIAIAASAAWLSYQLNHRPSLLPYAERWLRPAGGTTAGLRVTFLGVSTLLFDDGETAVLTDGFFTRPNRRTVFLGKVAPDPEVIRASLERAGVTRLAAVLVLHSHYDHALDSPEVAKRTGAVVVGSRSTANVALGAELPADRVRVVGDGDSMDFGRFHVTFVRSRHAPTAMTGGEIREPLIPPVRAYQYAEGMTFSVLIAHHGKAALVQSSAGFVDGALRGQRSDLVFLAIGALGGRSESYQQAYWREVVEAVGARRVIPVHWDDFMLPLDQPMVPFPRPIDDFNNAMAFVLEQGRRDGIDVKLAPVWTKIDPFAGL